MKNLSHTPTGLISLTETFGQKVNYKKRVAKNYQKWVEFQTPKRTNKHKNITDYANEILGGELLPLYKLVYDYAGSRMFITRRKIEITEHVRKVSHASNIKQQLRAMLLKAYNDFRIAGAVRNSDAYILNKFQ